MTWRSETEEEKGRKGEGGVGQRAGGRKGGGEGREGRAGRRKTAAKSREDERRSHFSCCRSRNDVLLLKSVTSQVDRADG